MKGTRRSSVRLAVPTLLAVLATAFALYSPAPQADERETYLRAAAQRDVATFDLLDIDHDGRLSLEEVRGVIDMEARFADFDVNRDGFITRAELARYIGLQYGVAVAP